MPGRFNAPDGPNRSREILAWTGAVVGLAAMVAVVTWLPSVGRKTEAEGRSIIEIWAWSTAAEALDLLRPDFERENPDIDIRVISSGANLQSRFLLGMAAGVGTPDISQLQARETAKFTATGRLTDLTDLAAPYKEDFAPAFWENVEWEGRIFAIPWDMGPCAVFYKRWIFDRYGIDPDTIETWDDFIETGIRLREASGGATAMMPLPAERLTELFPILMQQNGGNVFNEAGEIVLDSPENAEALAIIRRMVDARITTPVAGPELLASFATDSVATYPHAVWFMGQIKQNAPRSRAGEWGVFRLPAFRPGGPRVSNLGGSTLVIPAETERTLEAWRFVHHALCTVEGQVTQYRERGLFPAFLPALDHPYFDEPDPYFGGQEVNRLFAMDLDQIPPLVRTSDWTEAERMFNQTLATWLRDRQDNRAYLRMVAAALSRRLGRPIATPVADGDHTALSKFDPRPE